MFSVFDAGKVTPRSQMPATEWNDGLREKSIQKGEKRNPTGRQGSPWLRMWNRQIGEAIRTKGDERCTIEGLTHLTWFQAGMETLFRLHVAGEAWATREIYNRAFGRVPYAVDMQADVSHQAEVAHLTKKEMLARVDALRASLVADMPPDPDDRDADDNAERPMGSSRPSVIDITPLVRRPQDDPDVDSDDEETL